MAVKTCSACKRSLPSDDFGNGNNRDGKHSWCRECARAKCREWHRTKGQTEEARAKRCAYHKRYREENKEQVNAKERERHYLKSYGLTAEEYNGLIEGGSCGVCGTERDLCIDHDHASGNIRGVLCRGCNGAIGILGDSEDGLQAAIDYLKGAVYAF